MAKGQERDPKREAYWRRAVGRWRESGLGIRAFCRGEKLSEPSFYAWRRVLQERDQERASRIGRERHHEQPAFVPVVARPVQPHPTGELPAAAPERITLHLRGGRVLRLPASIVAERLAEIVHAIEGRP